MKFSEVSTDRAADLLCEIAPRVANIVGDVELLDELKKRIGSGKVSVAEIYVYGANKVAALVPIVLKNHREDAFSILGSLYGVDAGDIAKQKFIITLKQITEVVQDKDLMDFFKSLLPQKEQAAKTAEKE